MPNDSVEMHEMSMLVDDTTRFDRLVFYSGEKWGYLFRNIDGKVVKTNVDSVITSRAPKWNIDSTVLPSAKSQSELEPLSGGIFRKRYVLMGYDSLNFYFDERLKKIPYTLSATLDSIYRSKMYKMEIVTPKNDLTPQGGMISLEVAREKVKNEKEWKAFFERFRKMR